jgi:uncharacterized protein (TIGR03435 family)
MRLSLAATAVVLLCGSLADNPAQGQAPAADAPRTFEVASIRLNTVGGNTSQRALPNGSLTLTNNTARNIIRTAYGWQGSQVVGGPAWLDNERYDIVAKAAAPFNQVEGQAMLRALLAERFALVAHVEARDMPVFLLRVAAKPAGARLRPSVVDCAKQPICVLNVQFAAGSITGIGVSMPQLARNLMNALGRTIVDETGLAGSYDLELTFVPDPNQSVPGAATAAVDLDAPSLVTALEEQLGLKLEPGRAPVQMLVIDRVERPTVD